jgi:hypothetical protein
MKTKNKVLLSALAVLLLSASVPIALFGVTLSLPSQYDETFLGELPLKCQRLKETAGKRIIVVGGSSVPFGIRSDLLDAALPEYRTVDFGLYAALGTKVMMELSLPEIRSGDLVILSPEQNPETLSDVFDPLLTLRALDGNLGYLERLSMDEKERCLSSLPSFTGEKYSYYRNGKPVTSGIYQRSSFNEYQDIESPLRGYNVLEGLYDPNTPISFSAETLSLSFVKTMNRYAEDIGKKGAQLYYRFSPMNRKAVTDGNIDDYYDFLASEITFPILGNPQESLMDPEWFYDTDYHLNASGAVVYTKSLIQALKAEKEDSSPTSIDLPEKPPVPEKEVSEGDDRDVASFTYEDLGNGSIAVTGLSEEGKGKEELILPSLYQGKPVRRLRTKALSGAKSLTALTLPLNLSLIEDGAFSDTPALKEIILLSKDPSSLSVGRGLLDGCEADLYVDSSVLSAYRLDYHWSYYAERIFSRS